MINDLINLKSNLGLLALSKLLKKIMKILVKKDCNGNKIRSKDICSSCWRYIKKDF